MSMLFLLVACGSDSVDIESPRSLDEAFRIDIKNISVVYDIDPSAEYLDGSSVMDFEMREGQNEALFHFNPRTSLGSSAQQSFKEILLDGEQISISDLQLVSVEGTTQRAFKIDRELAAGAHRLEFSWSLWNWSLSTEPGWFRTRVDDSHGNGNERLFPTINSPGELARHQISLRIHSDKPYSAIGSAGMSKTTDGDVQVFSLDTEREVASYTVMVVAVPSEDVSERRFEVDGVPVTILSTLSESAVDTAEAQTRSHLTLLKDSFGEMAAPSVDIFLIDWVTGMEYYGATTTGAYPLRHELTHLYWGTAAVNATYRDSWLDESINVWWTKQQALSPITDGYRSDILSGHHTLSLGYDARSYNEGARVLASVAADIGNDAMVDFLNVLYRKYFFKPYTTQDFVDTLIEYTRDDSWQARFDEWVGKGQWAAVSN